MKKKYTLNQVLVARDEDLSFFNPETFKIYKFNESGYQILSELQVKGHTSSWQQGVVSSGLASTGQLQNFLKKCEKNSILLADN